MMDIMSRPRTKPLRTYGKRASTTPDPHIQSTSKRRRTESPALPKQPESTPSTPVPDVPSSTKPSPTCSETTNIVPKKPAAKGSIMSYFKPVPSSSSTVASSPKNEEAVENSTTPSSPPLVERRRRKPRILKFRGASLPLENSAPGGDIEEQEREDASQDPTLSNKELKEQGNEQRPSPRESQSQSKKKAKAMSSPTVQTTLNISYQAGFSECKVCDMVWNPLFPADVKYHMKRHASILRAKKELESQL